MTGKKLALTCFIFVSCGSTDQVSQRRFEDIKGYFNQEVERLNKVKTTISKTVSRNGVSEHKKNISPEWSTELALFSESDINKPAWSDSYKVNTDGNTISYIALDDELRTRSVVIKKSQNGKWIELAAVNRTSNYLYSSSEELLYIPDSLYRIIKKQDVVLLGKNHYQITGTF